MKTTTSYCEQPRNPLSERRGSLRPAPGEIPAGARGACQLGAFALAPDGIIDSRLDPQAQRKALQEYLAWCDQQEQEAYGDGKTPAMDTEGWSANYCGPNHKHTAVGELAVRCAGCYGKWMEVMAEKVKNETEMGILPPIEGLN